MEPHTQDIVRIGIRFYAQSLGHKHLSKMSAHLQSLATSECRAALLKIVGGDLKKCFDAYVYDHNLHRDIVRARGISLTAAPGEYVVNWRKPQASAEYRTTDLADALAHGLAMGEARVEPRRSGRWARETRQGARACTPTTESSRAAGLKHKTAFRRQRFRRLEPGHKG